MNVNSFPKRNIDLDGTAQESKEFDITGPELRSWAKNPKVRNGVRACAAGSVQILFCNMNVFV